MIMSQNKKGLGKTFNEMGINALLGGETSALSDKPIEQIENKPVDASLLQQHFLVHVSDLTPCSFQPRQQFDPASIESLADSIKQQGVLQPLLVRKITLGDGYEIIAGERRWRAAQQAGLSEVPVIIKELDDKQVMAISLIENIQREDLNALDQAEAMEKLLNSYEMTHQALADCLGYSRVAVSNYLRLNKLEPEVKLLLRQDKIDMGHARALLILSGYEQVKASQYIIENALSVRATEKWLQDRQRFAEIKSVNADVSYEIRQHEKKLSISFNRKVVIKQGKKNNGRVIISYDSQEDLQGLLNELNQV